MQIEFINLLVIFFTSIISGFGGWFFAKDKYKAEVQGLLKTNEGTEIDNLKKIIDIQQGMISNLSLRVNELENILKTHSI